MDEGSKDRKDRKAETVRKEEGRPERGKKGTKEGTKEGR